MYLIKSILLRNNLYFNQIKARQLHFMNMSNSKNKLIQAILI
jgi:hypothetical protein